MASTNVTNSKCSRWNGEIYNDFLYSKTENFDYDEYVFVTPIVNGYCLTAEITKKKGADLSEEDISKGFAIALCDEMEDEDFTPKSAEKYFSSLPLEFYTKKTYDIICSKLSNLEDKSLSAAEKIEENLKLFKEYAHFANSEEIPSPTETKHNREFTFF